MLPNLIGVLTMTCVIIYRYYVCIGNKIYTLPAFGQLSWLQDSFRVLSPVQFLPLFLAT